MEVLEAHIVLLETHATLFQILFEAAALPKNVQTIVDPDVIQVSFINCDHLVILVFRINLNAPLFNLTTRIGDLQGCFKEEISCQNIFEREITAVIFFLVQSS